MARFRIYYLKDSQRQHFRSLPPRDAQGGPLALKLKDYQEGGAIEASSPYAAWKRLREGAEARPIGVGDVLETEAGMLLVCRWAGFEEARWHVPEAPATAPGAEQAAG